MGGHDVGPTDPTMLAGAAAATPGEVSVTVLAGRYEILGLLGTGGMGRVYRVVDRELRETVALKVLHRDFVDSAEMVERFRQEVRLARRVTHRNVARTFDIGEHEGEKFLTMELIAGEPLSARLARGLLPIAETIAVAREIVAGMSAAHAVGVVHRDLKPDNVLLETGGRVVITDFGIARGEMPGSASMTSGGVVGTPAYMAPEQIGSALAIDARADIYAFGLILFEMLTGRRAWPGNSAFAVASARLVEPPPDPRVYRQGLSPSIAAVVLRCLARDREERFPSCAELDRALASVDASNEAAPVVRNASLSEARERSVAVLPFRNFGPPDDAYFVEGLTEDLVDTLATVRGLRVRGRGYVEASDRDVVDTGRRLGVDVVVDGSMRRAGEMLRVSARLVGVADGFQLWSSRFDRPAGAAFALTDEVAHAIAGALAAEHAEAPRAQPTDPIAIDLYFRAKHAIGRFWTTGGASEAHTLFTQALARAPNDPTILAGYISAQIGRNFFAPLDGAEATSLLRRALVAGGRLPEPWVALAAVRLNHDDDPAGAIRALKRALELAPSNSDAHDLTGRILLEADLVDDAKAHLERALWLDPRQRWARVDLIRAAALTGDWAKARELFDAGPGPEWAGHRTVHEARLRSWPGAPPVERTALPPDIDPRFRALIEQYDKAREARRTGVVPALAEIRAPMEAMMGRASQRGRARRFFYQMTAEQAAISGHRDGVLELVEVAVEEGLLDLAWMNRLGLLDPLRGDAKFEELHARVRERAERVAAAWHAPAESLDDALASLD
ncbi:MAG: protein kinase domain-containing protein [Polyangiales bacterium]